MYLIGYRTDRTDGPQIPHLRRRIEALTPADEFLSQYLLTYIPRYTDRDNDATATATAVEEDNNTVSRAGVVRIFRNDRKFPGERGGRRGELTRLI